VSKKRTGCLTWIAIITVAPIATCVIAAFFLPRSNVPVAPNLSSATTAVSPQIATIPGLQPVDIYLNLTNRGFKRSGPFQSESSYSNTCSLIQDGMEFHCHIHGSAPSNVTRIEATALNLDHDEDDTNDSATWFLGFVGSAPYTNGDAVSNRKWVEEHVSGGTMTASGVKFEITAGTPRSRILTITPSP